MFWGGGCGGLFIAKNEAAALSGAMGGGLVARVTWQKWPRRLQLMMSPRRPEEGLAQAALGAPRPHPPRARRKSRTPWGGGGSGRGGDEWSRQTLREG